MQWYEGKIIKIHQETSETRRFWIKIENDSVFQFRAGQFITLDLPISDRRTKRWRSYSIANAPNQTNVLELCIVRSKEGAGTTYLFEEAEVGTILKFKGPDGAFCLPELIEKDIVFICTGTGLAPFRSMLQDIVTQQKACKKLHLIFGTRTAATILYQKELEDLAQNQDNFDLDIVLSREKNTSYTQGYVHEIYKNNYKTPRPDLVFYLCGWSNMIDEAVANLIKMGYDRTQIRYELYG